MESVLGVSNARKAFGETQALDGASMALRRGEWLALLGPNGAGKTTLIRAIAGRVKLDGGSLTLMGQALNGSVADRRGARAGAAGDPRHKLGIVPQDIALYPLLTGVENLRVFGELNGVNGSTLNQRVEWALEWTGLADRAGSRVETFSGGMQRRLNIAAGVLHQPDVVLLDEPTVGVDPQSRQRIWEMLDELRKQGASLLLTTHQLDEAQQVCDRIVIIDRGRTIADGTFNEMVDQTIGRRRLVIFTLESEQAAQALGDGFDVDGRAVRKHVDDVAAELPALLGRINAAGARVEDLRIESPTLQSVFIHLTGRELRE